MITRFVRIIYSLSNVVLIACVTLATGCQTLRTGDLHPLAAVSATPVASTTSAVAAAEPASSGPVAATISVELYPHQKKPLRAVVPLTDRMTVQQALEKTQAAKRIGKMKIEVVRQVDQSGRMVKMGVDFESDQRAISAATNYALHPGDRIVVHEDVSSALDKMMAPLGPLAKALGV